MLEFIPFPAKDEQTGCKNLALALARFNLLECCPAHQKVGGSTPHQGMYLSCRFHPPWGVRGSNRLMFLSYMFLSHIDVSLSLSLSLSLPSSFSQTNAYNLRWGLKKKKKNYPWLVWLNGLSASLQTERSLVQFLVRGTCLGCGPGPQSGAHKRQPHIDVFSPSLSPSLPLSLSLKINK